MSQSPKSSVTIELKEPEKLLIAIEKMCEDYQWNDGTGYWHGAPDDFSEEETKLLWIIHEKIKEQL